MSSPAIPFGASPVVPVLDLSASELAAELQRVPYEFSLDGNSPALSAVEPNWGPKMMITGGSAFSDTFEKMLLAEIRKPVAVPYHIVEVDFASQVVAMSDSFNTRIEKFFKNAEYQALLAETVADAFRRWNTPSPFRIKQERSHRPHGGSMRQKKRHYHARQQ